MFKIGSSTIEDINRKYLFVGIPNNNKDTIV